MSLLVRRSIGCVAIAAALLLVIASPASAARQYTGHTMTEFFAWGEVAFDAQGNAWIIDPGAGNDFTPRTGIYKYSPYPSETLLQEVDGNIVFPSQSYKEWHLALDNATNEEFISQSAGRYVAIFDNGVYSHQWSGINGAKPGGVIESPIAVAIDNSNTVSEGRVYLALTTETPESDVEAFDTSQRPVDFPATASYIHANKLTGTPSGPFGSVEDVAVDGHGNIYVSDNGQGVVDEFDSTGTFVRSFGAGVNVKRMSIDPTNGNILISGENGGSGLEFDSSGNFLEGLPVTLGVNASGYLYTSGCFCSIEIYGPAAAVPQVTYKTVSNPTATAGTLGATVTPNPSGTITECIFEYGTSASYGNTAPCETTPASSPPYATATDVSTEISSLTTDTTYHYRVVVHNATGVKYGEDQIYTPSKVLGLTTEAATSITESAATLHASFLGNGEGTGYYFEWGTTPAYGHKTTESTATPGIGSKEHLAAPLLGLAPYTTYHYRIGAANHGGADIGHGEDMMFTTTPGVPSVGGESASQVHADRALLHGQVNPNGAPTTYQFEYVDGEEFDQSGWANAATAPNPEAGTGMGKHIESPSILVDGLKPGTLYHFRVAGTNESGTSTSSGRTFTTFPFIPIKDQCANAHVRQQTGTTLLRDCRAYELVSAAHADGYDVESDLTAGQTPFANYPEAENPPEVLYGIHNGALETGNPTNSGVDPYVATRDPQSGWSTRYVGIPANATPASFVFSSTLAEADAGLGSFAFGGPEICSPCFADGSTGIPVHMPNGELIQGMAGSLNPGPGAEPAGLIAKELSADGTHLVFGSTSKFEPDGNEGGDLTIYDRNLSSNETHVVSKTPGGATMTGPGIAELDISKDGSRIVIGQKVSEDADGNAYYHLYMNVGDSAQTIDLTPGATDGVLYDGMSADGSKVFFTTKDALSSDTDTSADLYEAEVSGSTATITRVSTGPGAPGGAGDTNSCEPVANSGGPHWNTVGLTKDCSAVAIGGGAGVASAEGSIYFLSPEQLQAGEGTQNQPNLYLSRPGQAPRFIATLEPNNPAVLDAVSEAGTRHSADFQITPNGNDAAFTSTLSLSGYDNASHHEIFRYDAPSAKLECASCSPTSEQATADAALPANGLGLSDDGRVLFNSLEGLVDRDLNEVEDAYQWEPQGTEAVPGARTCQLAGGCVELISTGISPAASSLLGISASGTDAYFFTREKLAEEDENGNNVRIYDARELGGFPFAPAEVPCKASDECHGAGSPQPPAPKISSIAGSPTKVPVKCKAGYIDKHGKCVRKPHHTKKNHKRAVHHHHGGGK